ncbi:uncharacterized protein [Cicer arietinum]|uniref:Uncharacterized protein LOC101503602 n=1 Tax=Cicer arietinum TaxID=3827 RepID=A0A1S2Z3Y1_CICAR|nr:uncharacterized protein LOC101503602 [Cicer arietinum]
MFLIKYFPEDIRNRKEMEFVKLEKGNMSVAEYAAKFEELSRYFPLYVGEARENSKCIKFEMGLRCGKQGHMEYECRDAGITCFTCQQQGASSGNEKEMEIVIVMRVVEETPMDEELVTEIVTTGVKYRATTMGHMEYECRDAGITCFNCQQQGHISTTCPYPRKTPQPGNQSSQASRPKSNGRLFALSGAGASEKDNLIQGTCLISDTPLFVLFDCGATHSFVSLDCVRRLGLHVSRLQYELIVNTPTSDSVDTSSVCLDVSIHVCGRDF